MVGTVKDLGLDLGLRSASVSGACTKKRGRAVTPESTSPFTPILDSSNNFTSSTLSYWSPPFMVVAIFVFLG